MLMHECSQGTAPPHNSQKAGRTQMSITDEREETNCDIYEYYLVLKKEESTDTSYNVKESRNIILSEKSHTQKVTYYSIYVTNCL